MDKAEAPQEKNSIRKSGSIYASKSAMGTIQWDRACRLKWLGDHQTILAALRHRNVMGAWQATWQHLRM